MEAGKGLGQINAEKEQYTRGVEQAKLDMQKKKIADDQMMRKLARIDAEEKETRRQQEWDAIAKRSREAVEESTRRWELEQKTRGALTEQQKLDEARKARTEQDNLELLKQVQAGQQTTQPTVTQPATQAPQQQGIMGLLAQKQDEWKGVPYRREQPAQAAPTPAQKVTQEDYFEGLKKQIITIDKDFKRRARVKAVSDEYQPKADPSVNEMRIKSKYNEILKTAEEKNKVTNSAIIKERLKVEVAKRKAEKPKRSKEYKSALNITSKALNDFKDAEDFYEKKAYILQKLRLTFPEYSSEINRVFGEY